MERIALLKAYQSGQNAWTRVWDGFVTPREAERNCPTERLAYAAWRKGFEEERERVLRDYPM